MIIGITGAICAGKRAFAEYLVQTYGFEFVDLLELFKIELARQGLPIQLQSSPIKKKNNEGTSEEDEESKSSSYQESQNNPEVESADSE